MHDVGTRETIAGEKCRVTWTTWSLLIKHGTLLVKLSLVLSRVQKKKVAEWLHE